MASQVPDFDSLPQVKGPNNEVMPQGCTWGLWDQDGKKDVYGTLNLLTPEVIQVAYQELRDGISVSLNAKLDRTLPGTFRKGTKHTVLGFYESHGMHFFDDELDFNTQGSSQWDSLMHWLHQPTVLGYNGTQPTADLLQDPKTQDCFPTLQHWHTRGGLVARAVLLDWASWWEKENQKKVDPLSGHRITLAELEACAKDQGVEFKFGDVLIIRTGLSQAMASTSQDELGQRLGENKGMTGLEGTIEAAKWIWNHHFSAVASDAPAFEYIPPMTGEKLELVIHSYLLPMFGMSIGELWALDDLAETCKRLGRYSFLLTSVPLNIGGLIGSPPNAMALF